MIPRAGPANAGGTDGTGTTSMQPTSLSGLRADALRFLRRFGIVAGAWSTLLAGTVDTVDRPAVLWVGVGILWLWALASLRLHDTRLWWLGWLLAGAGAELLGPAAGTGGASVAGGAPFVSIAAAALSGRPGPVTASAAVLSAAALSRGLVSDLHSAASSVGTVLVFCFGALALWWLVRIVQRGEEERDRLREEVAHAERERAVAAERAEAAARLHDSVLQSLAAITRAGDAGQARALAQDASAYLRSWIRSRDEQPSRLRQALERRCLEVAAGREITVGGAGDRPLDGRAALVVDAAVEAVRNAVEHTDGPVRVYAETTAGGTTVWIADRGAGFSLEEVPADRLGVRESIIGRLERAGGSAELSSGPEGSEWALRLPPPPPTTGDAQERGGGREPGNGAVR